MTTDSHPSIETEDGADAAVDYPQAIDDSTFGRDGSAGLETAPGPGFPLESGDVEVVFSAVSESEAGVVRGVLEAAGIPVAYDSLPAPTMGNVFSVSESSWGDVVVPTAYADAARAAIEEAQEAGREIESSGL